MPKREIERGNGEWRIPSVVRPLLIRLEFSFRELFARNEMVVLFARDHNSCLAVLKLKERDEVVFDELRGNGTAH